MSINAQNLVYSSAALKRMWGLIYRAPADIQVRPQENAVWVHVPGHRPRFVSKKEFQHHFQDWRRQQSQGLRVSQQDVASFEVRNPAKGTRYPVSLTAEGLSCTCHDYQNQQQFLAALPCCKHGWAVLTYLGYGSLEAYLADGLSA
jgi:hypothetical protein